MSLKSLHKRVIKPLWSDDDDDDELKFNDASTHGVILRLEGYTA